MAQRVIDFRSDTVTRPSPSMRQAMFEAEVGDDVFGDDPTVKRLQERIAELLGKEAGLFFPSGTMTNQAALHTHTRRGDEVFLHAQAHIIYYEQGGAAVLSSLQLRCFDSEDGTLDPEAMEEHVHRNDDVHFARTRVVALEDTHNHCGGLVYPLEKIRAVREFCDKHGLVFHLDGTRVWNAHVASGVPLADIAAPFDSVSVCLSKGLGAPVGSVLLDSAENIRLAMRARKVFGGGMRQAGILAAAGLSARCPLSATPLGNRAPLKPDFFRSLLIWKSPCQEGRRDRPCSGQGMGGVWRWRGERAGLFSSTRGPG